MMSYEEQDKRCKATQLQYYPDKVRFMCRVYGRWVQGCYDCAFDCHTEAHKDE